MTELAHAQRAALQPYRLAGIYRDADFRASEQTNYRQFCEHFGFELKERDCLLMMSRTCNQLVWILGRRNIAPPGSPAQYVLDSRKWRLESGRWDPYLVQSYAERVGIRLVGIKKIRAVGEDHHGQQYFNYR